MTGDLGKKFFTMSENWWNYIETLQGPLGKIRREQTMSYIKQCVQSIRDKQSKIETMLVGLSSKSKQALEVTKRCDNVEAVLKLNECAMPTQLDMALADNVCGAHLGIRLANLRVENTNYPQFGGFRINVTTDRTGLQTSRLFVPYIQVQKALEQKDATIA